jgi:hypothetical protein
MWQVEAKVGGLTVDLGVMNSRTLADFHERNRQAPSPYASGYFYTPKRHEREPQPQRKS